MLLMIGQTWRNYHSWELAIDLHSDYHYQYPFEDILARTNRVYNTGVKGQLLSRQYGFRNAARMYVREALQRDKENTDRLIKSFFDRLYQLTDTRYDYEIMCKASDWLRYMRKQLKIHNVNEDEIVDLIVNDLAPAFAANPHVIDNVDEVLHGLYEKKPG